MVAWTTGFTGDNVNDSDVTGFVRFGVLNCPMDTPVKQWNNGKIMRILTMGPSIQIGETTKKSETERKENKIPMGVRQPSRPNLG